MAATRRFVLKLLAQTGVLLGLLKAAAAADLEPDSGADSGAGLAPTQRRTLDSYLDTLIPEDALSPGAVAVGIGDILAGTAERHAPTRRFLAEGCRWLDAEADRLAGRGFAALDEPGREAVVARAAEAPEGSDPRRFFEQTRVVAFFYYYSDAASWPSLGYDGPPQPAGFMDYAEPPAIRRP